ncbi:MAG: cytochrome C [Spirochaetae bacterium HGW-Spirochaetae-1]|nr:MAG: cytochrome C [Spirochaetae bacterium HGW-Spirochaetae-1]
MKRIQHEWILGAALMAVIIAVPVLIFLPEGKGAQRSPWKNVVKRRAHLDHSAFFTKKFDRAQDVTQACLKCHEDAATDLMKTSHWKWEGEAVSVPDHGGLIKMGKKNLLNNFCLGIKGNWISCTSCHAGYGWEDDTFDFKKEENVDCLICHDWSGNYSKGAYGMPAKGVDLQSVAKSVGYPKRENCGICHIYGGGGMGVKHGDLDQTLVNAPGDVDVHMGKNNMLCVDCHKTEKHNIKGKAYSISVNHENGIACTDCHVDVPHQDRRINAHLDSLACETCHISRFAKRAPTKINWDWSKAGDPNRKESTHEYLKIKGEFVYEENVIPEYYWFNLKSKRYIIGDIIDPGKVTILNDPEGDIHDPKAKIWPFKVHRATQPYDRVNRILLQPVTSGKGGYWHEFNWDKALRLGSEIIDVKYSGSYGFTRTDMYWPIAHMVSPVNQALRCCECHGTGPTGKSRMNWKALGYGEDPADTGGRKTNNLLQKKESE